MIILLVFYAGDPGSIPVEGNISFPILFFQFLYILQQEFSSILHKINALAKRSHHLFFFFFF